MTFLPKCQIPVKFEPVIESAMFLILTFLSCRRYIDPEKIIWNNNHLVSVMKSSRLVVIRSGAWRGRVYPDAGSQDPPRWLKILSIGRACLVAVGIQPLCHATPTGHAHVACLSIFLTFAPFFVFFPSFVFFFLVETLH